MRPAPSILVRGLAALMSLVLASSIPGPTPAAAIGPTLEVPEPSAAHKHPKLDSSLVAVASAADVGGVAAGLRAAARHGVTLSAGGVRVIVTAKGDRSSVRSAIQATGGHVEAEYANLVQALLPPDTLIPVAELPSVTYVGQPAARFARSVVDEGVVESNAAAWQAEGVAGAGVKVGIIDLGFDGYPAAQASGDLPAVVTPADFGCGGIQNGEPHGTAVAEIVHKMAPSAQLYLICFDTEINLGQAKDYAIAQGVRIINHSVGWWNTSRGDGSGGSGTPDAIVADARANGILWVNAAGNSAKQHWSGTFSDPNLDTAHNFAGTDFLNNISIAAGGTSCAYLKWDDWPTSAQDFDLYLVRAADPSLAVGWSENLQDGSQPPTEALCYTNPGPSQSYGVVIVKYAATTSPRFDLFTYGNGQPIQYFVSAGSVEEPATSPHAMAAGAICWQTDALEPYSNQGPTIDGRMKPDIAGQTRASSSVYGAASGCAAGFSGTSASAPHVAGAAALVAEANPTFTPAQLQSFLESQALDRGAVGKDNQYGSGRLWLGTVPNSATGSTFAPITPARVLDTRSASQVGPFNTPFSSSVPRTFPVAGVAGVPADAVAVTGNLTVTQQTALGFVYLGPQPTASPPSSTLNFPVGDNRANNVTIPLSPSGGLSAVFKAVAGKTVHLIFDVTGYFLADDSGATYTPLDPGRILDSRASSQVGPYDTPFAANVQREFPVWDQGGVPDSAVAVIGNLTVTGQTSLGFLALGNVDTSTPGTSTLNFPVGDNRANGVTVALTGTGSLWAVYKAPAGRTAHVIFDVTGYYEPGTDGLRFFPLSPGRILDSRINLGLAGAFAANVSESLDVDGHLGVPVGAEAITANLTVTGQTQKGFAAMTPDLNNNPTTSTLNFPVGDNRANGVTVPLSGSGNTALVYKAAGGTTHLILDITGYFD